MKVNVETVSPIERKLSIEVDPTRVSEELSRAYSMLSRQVKIAGFRPGKVPRRILEQRFREQVEDDVLQRVMERAYLEAIRDHKVEAVAAPQVTNKGLKINEPFEFEARVQVKPQVEPKDYRGLPLKKVENAVTDARIAERLEQMRQQLGTLEPVKDRDVAQAKDYAIIDYDGTIDGKEFAGSKAESVTVEVSPGELVESHIAALEGLKVGETKEIDYVFPADYQVEEIRGKTARFKVTLKGLKVSVTPELNDDFAKEIGGGQTLEELRAKVRGDLERSEKAKADQDLRDQIIKLLVERNPFEVPQAMVDRASEMMLEGALRAMAQGGLDPRRLNLDFRALREEMRPRALAEVHGTLVLEAIAEKEAIQPTEAELDAKIDELAQGSGQPAQVRKHFRQPEQRRNIQLRLREDKTLEFLKSQATFS